MNNNVSLDNNQDQFNCDVIQFSGNKLKFSGKEIFNIIRPEITIISGDIVPGFVNSKNISVLNLNSLTVQSVLEINEKLIEKLQEETSLYDCNI